MSKLDMFNISNMHKENGYYKHSNYDTTPMAIIMFKDLPNEETKKLFCKIRSKYNAETHKVILDLTIEDEFKEIWRQFDILQDIKFQVYNVFNDYNDYKEVFVYYPVFVEVGRYPNRIELKIHDKFKDFCNKFDITYSDY